MIPGDKYEHTTTKDIYTYQGRDGWGSYIFIRKSDGYKIEVPGSNLEKHWKCLERVKQEGLGL